MHFFYDRNGELTAFARYYEDDEPIQDLYYYVKNAQGDITDITDNWGNIIASYAYDPWGKVLSVTGTNLEIANLNPFRYRSYYYDSDIEMYYLQSRYYDPEVGRFINCDDVNYIGATQTELSYNVFAYCENDAVNKTDHSGYITITALCINFVSLLRKIFNNNSFASYIKSVFGKKSFGKSPVSIKITGDTIKISAKLCFSGDLKNMHYGGHDYNKTYKELFLEGVRNFWSGNFLVFGHKVQLKNSIKESKSSGISVIMSKNNGVSNTSWKGTWSIGNYGSITIYRSRGTHFYSENDFRFVAAHEFGHILGVDDIYKYSQYEYVKSIFNVFNTPVQNIDVEMFLLAFINNIFMRYPDYIQR